MENRLYKKILGCIGMVAIGDAMGMPCHDMTIDEIRKRFKGPVETFHPPFSDTRVHQNLGPGGITDDTMLTLALAEAYIRDNGSITLDSVCTCAFESYQKAVDTGCGIMFGPSTRAALAAVKEGKDPVKVCLAQNHPMAGASNGAAMKISPAGLVHPANPDAAIQDAVTISFPSHCTQTAIASACAVAAGVSEAMSDNADVFSVVRASLYGARQGEAIGKERARTVPLPSVAERIELAVSLALKARDADEANRFFANIIGTGLSAYESIPTAIGIFVAAAGNPIRCVIAGANVGYDTDTIASMAGALSGALYGCDAVPKDLFQQVTEENGLNLEQTAQSLERIARKHLESESA